MQYLWKEAPRFHNIKGENVLRWLKNYCKRNKINVKSVIRHGEEYFEITFKSQYQLDIFQRKGNSQFPYFEFI